MEEKMMIIDPHVHMTSRTTDDYEAMAAAGVVAVIEPSFWLGQPRTQVGSFQDYFSSLVAGNGSGPVNSVFNIIVPSV